MRFNVSLKQAAAGRIVVVVCIAAASGHHCNQAVGISSCQRACTPITTNKQQLIALQLVTHSYCCHYRGRRVLHRRQALLVEAVLWPQRSVGTQSIVGDAE